MLWAAANDFVEPDEPEECGQVAVRAVGFERATAWMVAAVVRISPLTNWMA
jgi:hypothetical protein